MSNFGNECQLLYEKFLQWYYYKKVVPDTPKLIFISDSLKLKLTYLTFESFTHVNRLKLESPSPTQKLLQDTVNPLIFNFHKSEQKSFISLWNWKLEWNYSAHGFNLKVVQFSERNFSRKDPSIKLRNSKRNAFSWYSMLCCILPS